MLNDLGAALAAIAADLDILRFRYAVVGGLAVSRRTEPRMTRDVDVAVATSHESVDLLGAGLLARGYRQRPDGFLVRRGTSRIATLRFDSPSRVVVDLLIECCGIEREVVDAAEVLTVVPGLRMPFARTGHLIALKVLANRGRDRDDLEKLLLVADSNELDRARLAVSLIAQRGFSEGRDLAAEFQTWLGVARPGD